MLLISNEILWRYNLNQKQGKNQNEIEERYDHGIYAIKSFHTGKIYIGRSVNLISRMSSHLSLMYQKDGSENKNLINDCYRYDLNSFYFYILESFHSTHNRQLLNKYLDDLEDYYLFIAYHIFGIELYNLKIPHKQNHCIYEFERQYTNPENFNPYNTLNKLLGENKLFLFKNKYEMIWKPGISTGYEKESEKYFKEDCRMSDELHMKDDPTYHEGCLVPPVLKDN